jgi:predicted porin
MNKKLMAVAVAGALAVPAMAFAQASNVQIYGRVNAGLDNYRATGATAANADTKSRTRVFDNGSRIGFRGTENLGGGLQAVFLIESGLNIDTGNVFGQNGAQNTSTGFLASRIGHIGLQGNWGLLTFGRSNVWWGNGRNDQVQANYAGAGVGMFTGTLPRGMTVGITRQSNTVQYTSPTFGGFNAVLSFSPSTQEAVPAQNAVAATSNGTAVADPNGKLWGITLQGQFSQFFGGYDWVKSESNTPVGGNQGESIGNKLRVGWGYNPGAQVSLFWVQSQKKNRGVSEVTGAAIPAPPTFTLGSGLPGAPGLLDAAATNLKVRAVGLSWEHTFGNIHALAQWARSGNITGCVTAGACSDTRATQWMLGARYLMSKRTAAYVTYNQTNNDRQANQDYNGGNMTSAVVQQGADPRI